MPSETILGPDGQPGLAAVSAVPSRHDARIRNLAAQLYFAPDQGRVWMDQQRVVLMQAETYGDLRDALVQSLGEAGASVVILRAYTAAGRRDAAAALRSLGPQASLRELLAIGAMMHALQGYLLPGVVGDGLAAQDLRSDDYCGEAVWRESFEDELHVARHGVGRQPGCWAVVGYISGFLSHCAGREIEVRELECRATGSEYCRIEARPVARWRQLDAAARSESATPAGRVVMQGAAAVGGPEGVHPLSARPDAVQPKPVFLGVSSAYQLLQHKIARVAPTEATVLLLGESGVGKSVAAREVQQRSRRRQERWVEVNCAAIPDTLIESELFGVERGAYSGATQARPGRFEVAHGGTIFLDEIATLSVTAQGKLLRVLQSGEFERLGSHQTQYTNVRVIAATNEDLQLAVQEKRFREDLYYRLNVFPLVVPPLRERRDDIPMLTDRLLQRFYQRHGRQPGGITARARQALMHHAWPGNVRELENVLERAVILVNDAEPLDLQHLFSAVASLKAPRYFTLGESWRLASSEEDDLSNLPDQAAASLPDSLADLADCLVAEGRSHMAGLEEALVDAALRRTRGNVQKAALLLGLTRSQMNYRLSKRPAGER